MKKKLTLIMLFFGLIIQMALAQTRQISGTVLSGDDRSPLPGVSVGVKNSNAGTVTNLDGKYTLAIPQDAKVLIFRYVGFAQQEIIITASNTIDVTMETDAKKLGEVVVTALGITKEKKAIGYAVQEIGGQEVLGARQTNVVDALQGRVSGAIINKSAGTAGASSNILIRGANTISGNNSPLFVIDGVPVDNSQLSSGNPDDLGNAFLSSVANSNRAIDIPQEDIENISVLKGAAATALYGSQAGNGAIIITTKKGKFNPGKKGLNVIFTTGVDFSRYNKMVPLQNKYAQGISGQYRGPATGTSYSWGPLIDTLGFDRDLMNPWDKNGSVVSINDTTYDGTRLMPYDNVDNFFRTGVTTNTALSISGATEKASYYLSLGRQSEEGIIPNNTFKKTNIGFNGDLQLTEKIKIGSSIKYINSGGTRIEQGSNTSGVMLGLTRTTPSFDIANGYGADAVDNIDAYQFADGRPRTYRGYGIYDNPFWTVNKNPLTDDVNRVIGNVFIDYKPLSWLSVSYKIGNDFYSDRRKQYFAIRSANAPTGRMTENQYYVSRFNEDLILRADRKITDDFNGSLTLGSNRRSFYQQQLYTQGDGFTVPDFYHLSNASATFSREEIQRSRDAALFGMLDLDYKRLVYLSITGRREKSTTLPRGNNTFFYPSASISLMLGDIIGLKDNKYLPYAKVRASLAKVGLGSPFLYATSNYYTLGIYQDGWTDGVNFPFRGQAGFEQLNTLGDPKLRPETRNQFEIGADLRFLNNRIGLDFTYYTSKSNDLIFQVPISAATGSEFLLTNSGVMTNKGIEIILNASPIVTSQVKWDVTFNLTRNQNIVEKLAEGVDNVFLGGFTGANIRAQAGSTYGTIFGFGFLRDSNGKMIIGADGFPIIDQEEKGFGSAQPNFQLGITNRVSYKGFTLSALLDIRRGGVMWNGTKGALYFFGTHKDTETRGEKKVFDGVVGVFDVNGNLSYDDKGNPITAGPNTQEVVLDENWLAFGNGNGFFGNNTEDFIEKTDWFRIRNVSLSYTLPKKWLEKTRFQFVDITATGTNLFLKTPYTGVDPETSLVGSRNAQGIDYFNMPNTKTYGFSVRVGF